MTTTATDARHTLRGLVEICRDGEERFQLAASALMNTPVENELRRYSSQRREFAQELADTTALSEEPSESRSVTRHLHRAWINIKWEIASNELDAVLAECQRGEDSTVAAYRGAMESGLPSILHAIVAAQYDAVQRVHDRIKQLRDNARSP